MNAVAQIPVRMSVTEFLEWDPAGESLWQLVDGQPQVMAPANRTHGAIQNELGRLIGNHLAAKLSVGSAVANPGVIPHIQSAHNVRIPDIAVTLTGYVSEEQALNDPVLMIEILSMSNRAETWSNVWTYTTIPSVREIVVVHTVSVRANVLRRLADGSWPKEPESVVDGDLALESIGFSVPLADIYRTSRLASP